MGVKVHQHLERGMHTSVRIVLLTTSYPEYPGHPSGHFVAWEAESLAGGGHDVHVIAPHAQDTVHHGPHQDDPRTGVSVHRLTHGGALGWPGARHRLHADPWRAIGLLRYLSAARDLAATLRAGRTIVHWAIPGMLMVPRSAQRITVVSHGEDVRLLASLPSPARSRVTAKIAERVEQWRFVSQALRDSLELPPHVARAVDAVASIGPAAIELPQVTPATRTPGAARYVSIGRLVPSKNVERAIEYVSLRAQECELIVIGDGPSRTTLEVLAREKGVDATFLGLLPRDQTLAWLASSDALLMASALEGYSTVVREAEALHVPIRFL